MIKNTFTLLAVLTFFLVCQCTTDTKRNHREQSREKQIFEKGDAVSKEIRDFSTGKFMPNEIEFISAELSKKVKQLGKESDQFGPVKNTFRNGRKVVYLGVRGSELGYVPAIDFPTEFKPNFSGDFDKDGFKEIFFEIEVTAGGNASWSLIYCLKILPDNNFKLLELNLPCPCLNKGDCGESPKPALVSVKGLKLNIRSDCYGEMDPDCCPSSSVIGQYNFINNELILN